MRQLDGDVEYQVVARGPQALAIEDAAVLHDYFNLGTSLADLARQWCAADTRFCTVHPHLQGMVGKAACRELSLVAGPGRGAGV